MNVECINFDRAFEQYATQWMRENAARYGNNMDRMESQMPDVYLRWLNQPAKWLGGLTPGGYFAQYDDVNMLLDWMMLYERQRVPVPAQLMERLEELDGAEDAFFKALQSVDTPYTTRLTLVSLLQELDSVRPMELYIGWIAGRRQEDELADMAAESLQAMGPQVVPAILEAVEQATPAGQETFLDILCNFPGDEGIFTLALRLFEQRPDRRALFASYLGKIGDERAVAPLQKAAKASGINYLDYIELRNAIEELGGDAPPERDFAGDPFYESLRGVEGSV